MSNLETNIYYSVDSAKCSEVDNCKCVKEHKGEKYCAGCGSVVSKANKRGVKDNDN